MLCTLFNEQRPSETKDRSNGSTNPQSTRTEIQHTSLLSHIPATHIREITARANVVIVAHPALVLWVLPPGQDVLVASVVVPLIQHPAASIHPDGVTAAEVGVHVGAVRVALIGAPLEVFILVESDLKSGLKRERLSMSRHLVFPCKEFE